jgi:hypothetical protein
VAPISLISYMILRMVSLQFEEERYRTSADMVQTWGFYSGLNLSSVMRCIPLTASS